jgi:cell division protein FtsN
MARDYKHARRNSTASLSGGAGIAVGLLLGLMVAIAVYLHDRRNITPAAGPVAPMSDDAHKHGEKRAPASQASDPEQPLEFYDMLPKYEVVVPEKDGNGKPGSAASKVDKPGVYILQAGSYRNFADADRIRARLALQGVESKIQKVTVDNDTWHRVRIGPINKLADLEETRRKLREAQIDALVIRTGD